MTSADASASDAGIGDAGNREAVTNDAEVAPIEMPSFTPCPAALASGRGFSCALLQDGAVRCWGDNAAGQLGDGGFETSLTPTETGIEGARFIAASTAHACALGGEGAVWCWGSNVDGQLGGDVAGDRPDAIEVSAVPVSVPVGGGEAPPVGIFAGGNTTCTLNTFAHVWCWGSNAAWQKRAPMQVDAVGTKPVVVTALQPEEDLLRWVDLDGDVYAWDWTAQELEGPSNLLGTPTRRLVGDCELKGSGSLWCGGEWVQGLFLPRPTAVQATSLDARGDGRCVVDAEGGVHCTAAADDAFDAGARAPVDLRPIGVPASVIVSVGETHACSIAEDGGIWCWGTYGERDAAEPEQIAACTGQPAGRYRGIETTLLSAADVVEAHVARRQTACRCAGERCTEVPSRPSLACLDALTDAQSPSLTCTVERDWRNASAPCGSGDAAPDCAAPEGLQFCSGESKQCRTGDPLLPGQLCDGALDCDGGEDELNCDPRQTEFRCDAVTSITIDDLCDGTDDCENGWDEVNCSR